MILGYITSKVYDSFIVFQYGIYILLYVFWLISIVLLSRNGVLPNLGEKLFAKNVVHVSKTLTIF